MTTRSERWVTLAVLMAASGSAAAGGIEAGRWSQHVRIMAAGVAMQVVDATACYGPADTTDSARGHRLEISARRLIDPGCTVTPDPGPGETHFSLSCGGSAAGSGSANVAESGPRGFSQHIDYRNDAGGGIVMQYDVEAHWVGPECSQN